MSTTLVATNVSVVYLAPTVAGNVSSYTITPALPTGLSFHVNTGVISGTPTAASAVTIYTITATGGSPSRSTNTTISLSVTSNYFNNAAAISLDALFTATINCVSIAGNVYHDVNGLADNTLNANGTQFTLNQTYVVRVNPTTDLVIDSKGISAGGAYSFGTVTAGTYALYVSATAPTVGSSFTAANFPTGGYAASGENLVPEQRTICWLMAKWW